MLLYVAACASVLNIFMQTRGMEEGSEQFGLARMLDGNAKLPFVKRQLLPQLANQITAWIPADERQAFVKYHLNKYHLKEAYFERGRLRNAGHDVWTADYALKFHLIYGFMFVSLLGTLYLLRGLAHTLVPTDNPLAPLLPVGFALMLPLTFMHGGFLYDFSELLFLAALLLTAAKGEYRPWIILLPLAVFNKETAILAPALLVPLLWANCRSGWQRFAVVAGVILAGAMFWGLGQEYAANSGGDTEWHLPGNLDFWGHPGNYFLWADFYAPMIPMPRSLNVLLIAAFAWLLFTGWRTRPAVLRQLFWLALMVNLPLFIFFSYRDEVRNLSLLFIPVYLLAAHALLSRPRV